VGWGWGFFLSLFCVWFFFCPVSLWCFYSPGGVASGCWFLLSDFLSCFFIGAFWVFVGLRPGVFGFFFMRAFGIFGVVLWWAWGVVPRAVPVLFFFFFFFFFSYLVLRSPLFPLFFFFSFYKEAPFFLESLFFPFMPPHPTALNHSRV